MAKKQRGKITALSKTVERNIPGGKMDFVNESSDDEVPEEVTFEDSKAAALRSMKQALDTVRREKEALKEKRRKRQELFQEQKKRKLLPADVLEEIDSTPSKKQKESEDEEAEENKQDENRKKKKQKRKAAHKKNLEGNCTVMVMKESSSASIQQQAAEDFIQSRLYGPGSCRTTSNELLSLQNKKGKNQSASVQFVKKNWASKQKAKAEKLKKRWIHKQIPS